MQDPEPNSGKMSGLKLDQIKGILKSEGEENVFEIGASLVLDPGQSIRTTESEDGSAVVINDQLVKAKEDLTKAITDESDRAIAKEGEIEANLADAVSDLQEDIDSNVADLEAADKAEAEARESADKSIMATAAENKSELNDKIEKTKEDLTTALTEGDAAIQKQIDFILEGSTEKLDQVVEIVQHIENIDVENDASLASAVASLTATDIANKAELTKFIEDEITGLNEELEANVADLEAADKALDSKLDETKAELNQAIENENDRATTKEAEIEANLADAVKDLEDADKAETEAREDADKAETEAREKADKSEAEAREAGDKELFVKIDETKAELNQAISTAVSQAVQNEDFTQDSISLLGKSVGETVSFEVSGNAGVVLVFANGLYVPSTTSFDEEGEKTTVSFEMFFEGGEDDFAHFMTVDFS